MRSSKKATCLLPLTFVDEKMVPNSGQEQDSLQLRILKTVEVC